MVERLIEYARGQFKLDQRIKGSEITLRDSYEQYKKTKGHEHPSFLELPECPEELTHIYFWYCELSSSERLSYSELNNWSTLTQRHITSWEVDVLMLLDRAYWSVVYENQQ